MSDFVSIPGFNNRGKGFIEYALILLNILSLSVSLIFFTVPSQLERKVGYACAGLIGLDLFLVLVIPRLRSLFIGFGFVTLLWTLFVMLFGSLSDFLVERAKIHEEIRLTGRPENRRTGFEYFAIIVRTTGKACVLFLIFLMSLNFYFHAFDARIKPWGELVTVRENYRLHLACYGDVHNATDKDPVILVESGQYTSSEDFSSWIEELYHLGRISKMCIYDRPGFGFSDSVPSPSSIGTNVDLLYDALAKKDISGPFLLVGFDIGGLYSRVFASKHLSQTHSLLLVDAWSENLLKINPFEGGKDGNKKRWENLWSVIGIRQMNRRLGLRLWFRGILSPFRQTFLKNWILHKHGSNDRLIGDEMRYQPRFIRAKLQELTSANLFSYGEVVDSNVGLQQLPISVVSSNFMIKRSANWGKWQRDITKISSNTAEWVVSDGGHDLWNTPKSKTDLQNVLLRMLGEKV